MRQFLTIDNARAFSVDNVPLLSVDELRTAVVALVSAEARLVALTVWQINGENRLVAVVADSAVQHLLITSAGVGTEYPSLTPECPSAHFFEREIFEEKHITPIGHPWLKPVRRPAPGRVIGDIDFFQITGPHLHEVGVGPVHAGVIEPGHFRFICDGEKVLHLEISLGYQHRGLEAKILAADTFARRKLIEVAAGDSTIAHTTAYCQAVEALAAVSIPPAAALCRAASLELERLANHIGDLGALSGDAGFLPSASYCGRLRGDILNTTALLCGNRFGRGLTVEGGTAGSFDEETLNTVTERIKKSERECRGAVELMLDTPSVLARFDAVGTVAKITAQELGLVGVAARASGVDIDTRYDFPVNSLYDEFAPAVCKSGDVGARAQVRWAECKRAFKLLPAWLAQLPADGAAGNNIAAAYLAGAPSAGVVSLVEGWRGEVCHIALTDTAGALTGYKIIDPSFHNWMGLAQALRNEEISNFPLCNKSFNLSYCGTDL